MRSGAGRILVVEDERTPREPLEYLLQMRHFEVVSVDTVDGALASAKAQPFDAAIVDLNLHGKSGREVVVRLPGSIPIIIFSGTVGESFQLERIRPRTRLVEKPCSLIWLIDTLDAMLADSRQPAVASGH